MTLGRDPMLAAFIAVHVAAVGTWLLHVPAGPLTAYTQYVGLWQYWDMFAPDPGMLNGHVDAEITMADGTRLTWRLPRTADAGLGARYLMERHRKWAESLTNSAYPVARDQAALFAARKYKTSRPVHVDLVLSWSFIPAPERGLGQPPPAENHRQLLVARDIAAGEL